MARPESDPAPFDVRGAVARALVSLYKEFFGRGPTRAEVHWCGPDTLVCILHHTLTPAERKLAELGEHAAIREMRSALQHASIAEFCAPVEQITGRKVRSFHSTTDSAVDGMAVELFVLHPPGYDGASRADLPH